MLTIRSNTPVIDALDPRIAVSVDPGTRNLGWAILKFSARISFVSLQLDTNYQLVDADLIDLKKNPDGTEGDDSLSHIGQMVDHHIADGESGSLFVKTMRLLRSEARETYPEGPKYEYHYYGENQEGIGEFDRETNPYLADSLMAPCFVGGAISSIMRGKYNIKNISHPGKTSKWGNTSCPVLKVTREMTKAQKRTVQTKNKAIRKDFFVYLVMDILERQRNHKMIAKMNGLTMEDRAHLCDSITQGMRGLMVELWLLLEKLAGNGVEPKTTKLPPNILPDDVYQRVYKKVEPMVVKASIHASVKKRPPPKNVCTLGIKKRRSAKPTK